MPDNTPSKYSPTASHPWQDADVLRDLYVGQQMSHTEIADELGCTTATVSRWTDKHDIDTRERSGATSAGKLAPEVHAVLSDGDELRRRYLDDQQTQGEIATDLGCSPRTVREWMQHHGIDARSETDAQRLAHASERAAAVLSSEDRLRALYLGESMSVRELADELDCSIGAISRALAQHDIDPHWWPVGDSHPQWKGGSGGYYGPDWPEQRQQRLEYDGHECVVCHLSNDDHKEQYGTALHVHHITAFRQFYDEKTDEYDYAAANRLENLMTLCCSHHREIEQMAPLRPQICDLK